MELVFFGTHTGKHCPSQQTNPSISTATDQFHSSPSWGAGGVFRATAWYLLVLTASEQRNLMRPKDPRPSFPLQQGIGQMGRSQFKLTHFCWHSFFIEPRALFGVHLREEMLGMLVQTLRAPLLTCRILCPPGTSSRNHPSLRFISSAIHQPVQSVPTQQNKRTCPCSGFTAWVLE